MALVFAMGLQKRASLVVVFALGGILYEFDVKKRTYLHNAVKKTDDC